MGKYDKLLSPIQITPSFRLKNRVVKAPASTYRWNEDGTAEGSDAITLYESIAKGGAAGVFVSGIRWKYGKQGIYLGAYDDKFIPGMQEFNEVIHRYDCRTIAQLHHAGPSAWSTDPKEIIGPSDMTEDEIPTPPPFGKPVMGLSVDEIHELQEEYIQAVKRCQQGGFDGVDVHVAHAYLFESFTSPIWNKRTDEYGCQNVENRTRIACEVIRRLREECGPDFAVGVRMNGEEFAPDRQGITQEMAVENAKAFAAAGAQWISVSCYGYGPLSFRYVPDYFNYPDPEPHMRPFMDRYYGRGLINEPTAKIKKAVDVPVFTAGRLDEDLGEAILEDGQADVILINRQLWADPEFVNKVASGQTDRIRRCTRCASCEDPVTSPRICRVNPALGQERFLTPKPAETKKKVMVIGGGPAGMEAALTASERGHEVTLYEKTGSLGGRTKLAQMIKSGGPENVMPIYDWWTGEIARSDVKVKLKTEVTPQVVKREKPDVVIVANSAPYYVPDIPGIDRKNVFTVPALSKLAGKALKLFDPDKLASMSEKVFPVGKKIVVMGGSAEGAQCAEFLVKRDKEVVIVLGDEELGGLMPLKYKERLEPWFKVQGTRIIRHAEVTSIERKGVHVKLQDGTDEFVDCDSVMVMLPEYHDTAFVDSLAGLAPEIYEVGSTRGGDNAFLKHAIMDGRKVGCMI